MLFADNTITREPIFHLTHRPGKKELLLFTLSIISIYLDYFTLGYWQNKGGKEQTLYLSQISHLSTDDKLSATAI